MKADNGTSDDLFLESMYRIHYQGLYNYVMKFLYESQKAQDIVQETFIKILSVKVTISGLREEGAKREAMVKAWLYSTATHLALDQLRRQTRHQIVSITSQEGGSNILFSPIDIEASVADQDCMHQALAKLPERQRICVLLSVVGKFKLDEIAVILKRIGAGTPGWDLTAARISQLRKEALNMLSNDSTLCEEYRRYSGEKE